MKTLFKSKMMFLVILTGLLFSCKNNNNAGGTESEGYNDGVEPTTIPVDTTGSATDSTQIDSAGTNGAGTTNGTGTNGSGTDNTGGTNGTSGK